MAKYRHHLPQLKKGVFLSDGGLETYLLFDRGIDLPHFAAFPLVDSESGRTEIELYLQHYHDLARQHGTGFIMDTPTWRANPDWGPKLGYSAAGLRAANARSVAFVRALRDRWETPATPCVINGVIGPRGDGYKLGNMDPAMAEDYHSAQMEVFAQTDTDMVSAMTMNTSGEAIGIARAAKALDMPCVISFTVETDGRLLDGTTLRQAIESADEATGGSVAYFMINCAHPSHFDSALERGESWVGRIGGIRANASTKSHAELDESTTLDNGQPDDLGRRYRDLRDRFPSVRVLGGCCGTDHRHIAAICQACLA